MKIISLRNKMFFLFALCAFAFGLLLKNSIYDPAILSLFFLIVITPIIIICSRNNFLESPMFLFKIVLISFIIKILAVFIVEKILIEYIGIPFIGYKDDYVYNESSSEILKIWKIRGFGFYDDVRFGTGFYSGYPVFSAFAKYIFGDHYLVPRFMNVFFSSFTIVYFYKSIKIFSTEYISKLVTVLFAFSSVFFVFSALQLKDTVLLFFVSILVYSTLSIFNKGISARGLLIILVSIVILLFYRAAIILPYLFGLICTYFITKRQTMSFTRIKELLGVVFVLAGFIYLWDFLHSLNILGLDAENYFDSRFSRRGDSNVNLYEGTNSLSKLGSIVILLGPILILFSLFLPTPVYVKLDELSNSVNYSYLPTLEYYAILPMVLISIIYVMKNFKLHRIGIFLLIFLMMYKVGQATGKSIFDSRQSLPAIYLCYLFLGYFNISNEQIYRLWNKYKVVIISIMLIIMAMFTYMRTLIRE